MLHRSVPLLLVALTVGCGGATELGAGGDGSGGTGSSPTSGSGDTSSSTTSSTSSTNTTGPNCICEPVECPDGLMLESPDGCCPICTCEGVSCEPPVCPSGETVTPPGHCCPQCVDLLCAGVVCAGPSECNDERTYTRPDGACCAGCMPVEPPSCNDIECAPDVACAPGYVRGDLMGGCCYECLPDPLYCQTPDDCVRADRPRSCCGCPEVISLRALDDDPCWRPVEASHPIPDECYPDAYCDMLCGACPAWGEVACVDNRCKEVPLQ